MREYQGYARGRMFFLPSRATLKEEKMCLCMNDKLGIFPLSLEG